MVLDEMRYLLFFKQVPHSSKTADYRMKLRFWYFVLVKKWLTKKFGHRRSLLCLFVLVGQWRKKSTVKPGSFECLSITTTTKLGSILPPLPILKMASKSCPHHYQQAKLYPVKKQKMVGSRRIVWKPSLYDQHVKKYSILQFQPIRWAMEDLAS